MTAKPTPRVTALTRPYWDAAREHRLVLQHCRACGVCVHYPRPWCPACWSADLEWRDSTGRGRVHTFSVVHQPPFDAFSDVPYVLAVIKLEEGPQIMANVVNIDPAEVRVDLGVRVCYEEREGGFVVPQFEPDPS